MSNPRTGIVAAALAHERRPQRGRRPTTGVRQLVDRKRQSLFCSSRCNRIWAQLFGKGLVEPIDDFRSSNPSVNTELLDALAIEFEESDFDRKHVLRLILNSHTWQRSSETNDFNETDDTLFSHSESACSRPNRSRMRLLDCATIVRRNKC